MRITLLVAAAALAACSREPRPATPPAAPAPTALTEQDLRGATYRLRFVEMTLDSVRFADGPWRDSANSTTVTLIRTATGDLDGDGRGDGVAVIGMNFGGTGTFISAVPVLNRDGVAVAGRGAGLGDRTNIRSVEIDAGTVAVGMIAHRPDDPACCPTDTVMQLFRLAGDSLALQLP